MSVDSVWKPTTRWLWPFVIAMIAPQTQADSPTSFGPGTSRSVPAAGNASARSDQKSASPSLTRPARSITPRDAKSGKKRASGSIWKSLGALLFVVVLIVVGAKLLGKHAPRLNGGIPTETLEVLGKRNIDQRQTIHLVRLGSRILVLGGSQQGLHTLAEITDPVEVDTIAGMCRRDENDGKFTQGFLALFRRKPVTDNQTENEKHRPFEADASSEDDAEPKRIPIDFRSDEPVAHEIRQREEVHA